MADLKPGFRAIRTRGCLSEDEDDDLLGSKSLCQSAFIRGEKITSCLITLSSVVIIVNCIGIRPKLFEEWMQFVIVFIERDKIVDRGERASYSRNLPKSGARDQHSPTHSCRDQNRRNRIRCWPPERSQTGSGVQKGMMASRQVVAWYAVRWLKHPAPVATGLQTTQGVIYALNSMCSAR